LIYISENYNFVLVLCWCL